MRQFITAADTVFGDIEQRATSACVCFYNQELPPDTVPARTRVGFEIDPTSGQAKLLVDIATYTGPDQMVRRWLETGELAFPDFNALRAWIREDLASLYRRAVPSGASTAVPPRGRRRGGAPGETLTDPLPFHTTETTHQSEPSE